MDNTTVVRVLIVEDNDDDCQLIRQMLGLAETPYAAECCASLTGALDKLRGASSDAPFDVLLLDLQLNDVSLEGGARGDSLRAIHHVTPQLPVVVLTGGVNDQESAARLMDAGAANVVKKMTLAGTLEYDRVIKNALLTVCPLPPTSDQTTMSKGPRCPLPGRRSDDPMPDSYALPPHMTEFRGYEPARSYGHALNLMR